MCVDAHGEWTDENGDGPSPRVVARLVQAALAIFPLCETFGVAGTGPETTAVKRFNAIEIHPRNVAATTAAGIGATVGLG